MSNFHQRGFLKPLNLAIAAIMSSTPQVGAFSTIVNQATVKSQQAINSQSSTVGDQLVINSSHLRSGASQVAYHYSHQSHSSHMSHQSHSSHYSSRW